MDGLTFVKQCKGKMIDKIPSSKLFDLDDQVYLSIKYDGNYVQIHKIGNEVKFFTSGAKEFYLEPIANLLIIQNKGKDFILEAEFLGKGEGKLGDRGDAAVLTSYRTRFNKGQNIQPHETVWLNFKVFDMIYYRDEFAESKNDPYDVRISRLKCIKLPSNLHRVTNKLSSYKDTYNMYSVIISQGYEGVMIKKKDYLYQPGKRINEVAKIKRRHEVTLTCIDIEMGRGKYEGMLGALVLKDGEGRVVKVGTGLSDDERGLLPQCYVGKEVEIEYEMIIDTYIHPVFKRIKE